MHPQQSPRREPASSGSRPSSCPAPAGAAAAAASVSDAGARLAALPSGVLALTVHGEGSEHLLRARPLARQSAGRAVPGRPHLGRNRLVGGWTVDLAEVFREPETEWYALGLGINALAVNVDLGTFEREQNRLGELAPGLTRVQTDALIFPPLTRGVQPSHGRLLVARDGRVHFEARDNGSVFDRLGARTLLIPDLEEPEHHPPFDLESGVSVALQSGAALVPGASSGSHSAPGASSCPLLRLVWKPFDFSAAPRPARVAVRRACEWTEGPLG